MDEGRVPGEAYENETQKAVMGSNSIEEGNDILGKFNPGLGPQRFDQEGAAKFVPKGSDVVYELHYTTNGRRRRTRPSWAWCWRRNRRRSATTSTRDRRRSTSRFRRPTAAPRSSARSRLGADARLVYAQPHMHLRGKDFELRVIPPNETRRPC